VIFTDIGLSKVKEIMSILLAACNYNLLSNGVVSLMSDQAILWSDHVTDAATLKVTGHEG